MSESPVMENIEIGLVVNRLANGDITFSWDRQKSGYYEDHSWDRWDNAELTYRVETEEWEWGTEQHTRSSTGWSVDRYDRSRTDEMTRGFHTEFGVIYHELSNDQDETERDCEEDDYLDHDDPEAVAAARANPCCFLESIEITRSSRWWFENFRDPDIPLTEGYELTLSQTEPPGCR